MPIIDLGYRRWEGARSPRALRMLAITATGMQLAWRGTWIRRLLLFAWLPAIPMGAVFFIFEQGSQDPEFRSIAMGIVGNALQRPDLASDMMIDSTQVRHDVWSQFLLVFFRNSQAVNMVLLFGLVAPRLISFDLRSRAYLLYFSRPLSVAEYLIGKALVLVILLVLTTTVPALVVYAFGLLLSPDTNAITQTWDLPFRVLVASVTLAIPTSALAIAYSAFTKESRYASFAWFGTWILGGVTYGTLTSSEVMRSGALGITTPQTTLISPYHALGEIQSAIYGVPTASGEATNAALLVTSVTIAAMIVAYVRVSGQLRL